MLYNFEPPASDEEVRGAALQYVRKISGFTKPSQANAETFERAVEENLSSTAPILTLSPCLRLFSTIFTPLGSHKKICRSPLRLA